MYPGVAIYCHHTLYWASDNLSMLVLKLIYISRKSPRAVIKPTSKISPHSVAFRQETNLTWYPIHHNNSTCGRQAIACKSILQEDCVLVGQYFTSSFLIRNPYMEIYSFFGACNGDFIFAVYHNDVFTLQAMKVSVKTMFNKVFQYVHPSFCFVSVRFGIMSKVPLLPWFSLNTRMDKWSHAL